MQENAGNDPNTQIVPSGGGTKWQKVEEPQPAPADPRQSSLTAGSTWASTQGRDSGWQPSAPPFQALPPPRPGTRRLNPHEYPSLSAAAAARQQSLPRQPVPSLPDGQVLLLIQAQLDVAPSLHCTLLHLCIQRMQACINGTFCQPASGSCGIHCAECGQLGRGRAPPACSSTRIPFC